MNKILLLLRDSNGLPIDSGVSGVLIQTFGSLLEFTGTNYPNSDSNLGYRLFADAGITPGAYNVSVNGVINPDINPIYISGDLGSLPAVVGTAAIQTYNIADGAVTGIKIGTSTIQSHHLTPRVVNATHIGTGVVATEHLGSILISKSKLDSDIFGPGMTNTTSGWNPLTDGVQLQIGTAGLEIIGNSITEDKLPDNAILERHLTSRIVTSNKIGTSVIQALHMDVNSVGATNIIDYSVTSTKIGTGAVTASKIGTSAVQAFNIADAVLNPVHLSSALYPAKARPENVAFVSPGFDNTARYYTTLQAAVDYLDGTGETGTVYIYPGTYGRVVLANYTHSLIGLDASKCIISYASTVGSEAAILYSASGSQLSCQVRNLTIECTGGNADSIGIDIGTITDGTIFVKDCIVRGGPSAKEDPSWNGVGVQAGRAIITIENCYLKSYGGENAGSSSGGQGIGVALSSADSVVQILNSRILAIGGSGTGTGKAIGVYLQVNSPDTILDKVTIDSADEAVYADVSTSPIIINSMIKTAYNANVGTSKIVALTINANTKVI